PGASAGNADPDGRVARGEPRLVAAPRTDPRRTTAAEGAGPRRRDPGGVAGGRRRAALRVVGRRARPHRALPRRLAPGQLAREIDRLDLLPLHALLGRAAQ